MVDIRGGNDGLRQASVIDATEPPGTPAYVIEQLVAEELGNSSYVVADTASGEAAVIDPVRDVDQYLDVAQRHGWHITHVLDTHVHNDFLSGGAELAAAGHGRYLTPAASGGDRQVAAGDLVRLGAVRLDAVATPGHTPEHLSYRLLDAGGIPRVLFSGGALMVGTIARPDLLGADHTYELAHLALDTVRDVLLPMADDVDVRPTHGGGSFCGAATSHDRATTMGRERRENRLLRLDSYLDFLAVYSNQGEYPAYYARMAPMNREGVPLLGVPLALLPRLAPEQLAALRDSGHVVVDVRPHVRYDAGSVPGALNVGVNGALSAWLGWVIALEQPILLVADEEADAEEAHRMLLRIGVDRQAGWTRFADWEAEGRPLARMRRGDVRDLARHIEAGERVALIDVRQEHEWAAGHLPGAVHALPHQVLDATRGLGDGAVVAVHCSTGYRSSLAASLLAREGRLSPWHLIDGVKQWRDLGYPLIAPGL